MKKYYEKEKEVTFSVSYTGCGI
ncbi:uncharacterized protein METZ01_LOCUS222126 [marine metagenome]|uniref:Uncharacterized protein n=1 Tax=marine metagenome TaxID=408172 RepID=A0A382G331_9ZZZZ